MVLESRDLHFGVRDLVRFFDFGRVGPALSGMRKTRALGSRAERFIAKVSVSRGHEGPAGPKLNFAEFRATCTAPEVVFFRII